MDNDLISRQAAIESLEEPCKVPESWTDEYAVGERAQYEKDVKVLNSLPSAERRGRWIYKSELYSYCGRPFYPKICSVCNGVFEYTTNYCPNCGARMDGEEK